MRLQTGLQLWGPKLMERIYIYVYIYMYIYRVSQEECEILRESVSYVKVYRYNPKHLYPKLNGYGDNGQRKVWTSCISAFYTPTTLSRATPPSGHMTACERVRWLVLRRSSPAQRDDSTSLLLDMQVLGTLRQPWVLVREFL